MFAGPPQQVDFTPELMRVIALPRRQWSDEQSAQLALAMTASLRQPMGQMILKNVQAVALYELHHMRGLFGVMRVGSGKTLVSLLAPVVVGARRPLLFVPAKLRDKTKDNMRQLSQHWRIPVNIRIESYDMLSRANALTMLDEYRPDLIVCDEGQKIRNPQSARTRRIARFMQSEAGQLCMFVWMTGTIAKRSIQDYARMLRWCVGAHRAPVPQQANETEEWAEALDERASARFQLSERRKPGALLQLCGQEEQGLDELTAARRAFKRRLLDSYGVVRATETPIDCTLTLSTIDLHMSEHTDGHIDKLRKDWELPDGQTFVDAIEMYRHIREMSLGFFYRWNPLPPDEWRAARKAWHQFCRSVISKSRTYDSEGQIAEAIQAGAINCPEYWTWIQIKDTFTPNTESVWFDYSVIEYAAKWSKAPGIVWCEHTHLGQRLADITGLPYYQQEGKDRFGISIPEFPDSRCGKGCIIASLQSNYEGRNLQGWNRNLVISPPPNGMWWEQLLGRTHREGQQHDEVTYDVITTCIEHYGAIEQAKRDAYFARDNQGEDQKILLADIVSPSINEIATRTGPRWSGYQSRG